MKFLIIILNYVIFGWSHIAVFAQGQGNYRFENYGNRSILLNGNVAGSVEDLGLTYYNPARLALVEKTAFAINAKAYQLSRLTLKDGFGENQKLRDSEFGGIPNMVAGTFELGFLKNDKFAYSFISRSRSDISLGFDTGLIEQEILEEFDGDELFVGRININNEVKDEWFGISWARTLNSKLSVGISGFFSVFEHKGGDEVLYSALHSEDQLALYNNEIRFEQKSYGLFWKLGVAWESAKLQVGVTLNLPYIEVYNDGTLIYEELLSGLGAGGDRFTFNRFEDLSARRKYPLGIAAGAGIPIGKSKLHTNLEWFNRISLYDRLEIPELTTETDEEIPTLAFQEELNHVVNFGIGAEIYISPTLNTYLSFSSDFSAFKTNANLFDLINDSGRDINFSTDYYHFGLGVDLKLKWADFVLGGTFTTGNSTFARSINFPGEPVDDDPATGNSRLNIERWRFIVGIDIPFVTKELEKFK